MPKKIGRPPKGEKKMRRVTLQMDPDDLAALEKLVKNHRAGTKKGGMTWSQYLRAMLLSGSAILKNTGDMHEAVQNARDALTGQLQIDVVAKKGVDEHGETPHSAKKTPSS